MPTGKKSIKAAAAKRAVKAVAAPPNDDAKWRAEDDARTLMRAEEIKRDRVRMAKARAIAKKQIAELSKVAKA